MDNREGKILDPYNVFVKFIPSTLTDEKFEKLFSKFGKIISAKIMKDDRNGMSLGYGFVRFSTEEQALIAIKHMHGYKIENKRLLCKIANQSSNSKSPSSGEAKVVETNNLYIKNLPKNITFEKLKELFQPFGNIIYCKVLQDKNETSRGIGFVRFDNGDSAQKAIQAMNGIKIDNEILVVKLAHAPQSKANHKKYKKNKPMLGPPFMLNPWGYDHISGSVKWSSVPPNLPFIPVYPYYQLPSFVQPLPFSSYGKIDEGGQSLGDVNQNQISSLTQNIQTMSLDEK